MEYTKPLAQLIEFFQKFPGVGPKSAQRMALYLLFPLFLPQYLLIVKYALIQGVTGV